MKVLSSFKIFSWLTSSQLLPKVLAKVPRCVFGAAGFAAIPLLVVAALLSQAILLYLVLTSSVWLTPERYALLAVLVTLSTALLRFRSIQSSRASRRSKLGGCVCAFVSAGTVALVMSISSIAIQHVSVHMPIHHWIGFAVAWLGLWIILVLPPIALRPSRADAISDAISCSLFALALVILVAQFYAAKAIVLI